MAIPEFTLTAGPDGFSRVMGGVSMTAESLEGLEVTFTPNIMGGQFLLVDGGQRFIDSVTVTLDEDGKINGDTGIKLLANDDGLDLEKPIQWTISFDKDFRFDGFKRQFSKWSFIAPGNGETKGLHELSHVTGLSATNVTRGMRGFSFAGFNAELSEDGLAQAMVQSDSGPVPAGDPVPLPSAAVDSLLGATTVGKNVVKAANAAEIREISGSAAAFPESTTITYTAGGDVESVTENGVTTTYTYNSDGTVATDTRVGVTRQYTYTDGNLTGIEEL